MQFPKLVLHSEDKFKFFKMMVFIELYFILCLAFGYEYPKIWSDGIRIDR